MDVSHGFNGDIKKLIGKYLKFKIYYKIYEFKF